ncbi:unnamed protein product [Dibothriocephalus latus]|uniref:Endonuclease/exonuclease/phosphatase domain-containing protein n=1 Tax=Dibothriocephalus latus TaxID=60516 RepID=A0A3P7NUH4_DIBLA|nr:unnamed protein product [Dibothriocephalus latus]
MVSTISAAVASPTLTIGRPSSPAPTPPARRVFRTNAQVSELATPPSRKLIQFNVNGLLGKLDQLLAFMRSHCIAVAAIQGTKWPNSTKVFFCADYTIVRRDRGRNKDGGLAFLVDKYIAHHQLPLLGADPTKVLAISFDIGPAPLTVVYVYIPPTFSCPSGFTASIAPYLLDINYPTLVYVNRPDIVMVTEIWASPCVADSELSILGYTCTGNDRKNGCGGGSCIYIKQPLTSMPLDYLQFMAAFHAAADLNRKYCLIAGDFNLPEVQWCPPSSPSKFVNLLEAVAIGMWN